jgi:hypothetical protein
MKTHWETEVTNYLEETIGITIQRRMPTDENNYLSKVPLYIKQAHWINVFLIDDKLVTLVKPRDERDLTPTKIIEAYLQLDSKLDYPAVLVLDTMTTYNRARLIAEKVPFIVPFKQLYIPFMMVDLREAKVKMAINYSEKFGPASQYIVLSVLRHGLFQTNTKELIERTGYTKMTVSRAIRQLAEANLCEIVSQYKSTINFISSKEDLWKKALPSLKSPVRKSVWIEAADQDLCAFNAGLNALSHYSSLNDGPNQTFATTNAILQAKVQNGLKIHEGIGDENLIELQLWKYAPIGLARGSYVDPWSLFLTLSDAEDERIQIALDQMIKAQL